MTKAYIIKYTKKTLNLGIYDGKAGYIFLDKNEALKALEFLKTCNDFIENPTLEEIDIEKLNGFKFNF